MTWRDPSFWHRLAEHDSLKRRMYEFVIALLASSFTFYVMVDKAASSGPIHRSSAYFTSLDSRASFLLISFSPTFLFARSRSSSRKAIGPIPASPMTLTPVRCSQRNPIAGSMPTPSASYSGSASCSAHSLLSGGVPKQRLLRIYLSHWPFAPEITISERRRPGYGYGARRHCR